MNIWKSKKRAITFAELMISLVVISILAAILYPAIAQFTPNVNKPLFKAAYGILTTALYEISNESLNGNITKQEIDAAGNGVTDTSGNIVYQSLCMPFCEKTNVFQEEAALGDCTSYCSDDTITTSNGMRWVFERYKDDGYDNPEPNLDPNIDPLSAPKVTDTFRITVDVNASNNDLGGVGETAFGNKVNGVFYYTPAEVYTTLPALDNPNGVFDIDRIKAQDTFIILVDKMGKIVAISPAGWAHLSDSLQSPD